MKKRQGSSKIQSVIIAVLAILLVGIMTTGVTYAFFTDKQNASDKLTFGVIKIEDVVGDDGRIVKFSGTQTPTREQLMPGDTITTDFTITLDEDSNDAWVRFKILASVSEDTYADVLGVKSYKVTNLLVEADGQTAKETVYFIYDNEEYVIEAGANVKKYVEGVATDVEDAEEAEVIKAAKNYVGEYVDLNDQAIVVTYAANEVVTGTDPETGAEIKEVKGVKAEVTKNGVAFVPAEGVEGQDGYNANEQAKIEEAVAFGTTAVVRIDAVEEAIRLLNESMANQKDGKFYGTAVTDEQTGEVTLGDGWIYRAEKLTNATEGTHTEAVEYSYTIPRKTTGNALQGVQVDFNLVVEAVQYDNNTSADNTEVDITNIGAGVDATTNIAAECIRAFYVAEASHEIVEAP